MPSKYAEKKPKVKRDEQNLVTLFYKEKPVTPRCTNCGRPGLVHANYSKCACGGTLQTFSNK